MGYRENIMLKRRTSKGIASYPPVSLTALSNNEKNNLLLTLEKLKQANEKMKVKVKSLKFEGLKFEGLRLIG